MPQLFTNNAWGTLASQLNAGATSLALTTGQGARFPSPTGGDYFLLTLIGLTGTTETSWEIVKCTARSTDTLTIVRAQEGTSDATWAVGTRVELRVTAAPLADLGQITTLAKTDSNFIVGDGSKWVAESGATARTSLGLGTAATTASTDYAPAAKGVTNGDSHNHDGGDGAQIAYSSLSGKPSVGKILQVVQASGPSSEVDVSSDSWSSLNLSASITPSAASSKVLVLVSIPINLYNYSSATTLKGQMRLLRASTELIQQAAFPYLYINSAVAKEYNIPYSCVYLDSPSTTSSTTYSLEGRRGNADTSLYLGTNNVGTITLLEVAA